ncbi:hypothetical protein CN03_05500 [Thalassolituus oleivorans]|uniref:glycosyltransferase n=1 Tax=Thalassolituus oleivorans TaxID=187493 RepID=UPI00094922D9|nr:glycosyltransferase [Thalassolituus oleivorans]APR66440.1 hypothetical protein CN03_05500 [Thalassolituus oleivorans]
MKVLMLSSGESIHTCRWVSSLKSLGLDIVLVTQHNVRKELDPSVKTYRLRYSGGGGYFANVFELKRIIRIEKPDILHAHFASGYGTLAKNAGFPYLLSVWGSDVYDFPNESRIKRFMLVRALEGCDLLYSTSECMKLETSKYTDKDIKVIPFGVDISKYLIPKRTSKEIVIGVVKVLAGKYGIDVLIDAFSIIKKNTDVSIGLKLVIAGDGPEYSTLKDRVDSLGLNDSVSFLGWVENNKVPELLATFDIFVVPSRLDSESFGVAAVEAGAARLPCVVSRVGGLPEVVVDGVTGLVVEKESPDKLAEAISQLILDDALRDRLGQEAFLRVSSCYRWLDNVNEMKLEYQKYLGGVL